MEKARKTYTIEVKGVSEEDIGYALDEVKKAIGEGYLTGMNWNETGEYKFESSGDYDAD